MRNYDQNNEKKDEDDVEYTKKKIEIIRIHGDDLRSKYNEAMSIIPDNSYQDYLLTRLRIRIGKELLPKTNIKEDDGKIIKKIHMDAIEALKKKPEVIKSTYKRQDYGKERFYFYEFKSTSYSGINAIQDEFEKTWEFINNMQYEQLTASMSDVDGRILEILTKYNIIREYRPIFDDILDDKMVESIEETE